MWLKIKIQWYTFARWIHRSLGNTEAAKRADKNLGLSLARDFGQVMGKMLRDEMQKPRKPITDPVIFVSTEPEHGDIVCPNSLGGYSLHRADGTFKKYL